ncbi:hypothetical protein EA74_02343 [Enterococcus hirae]|nr:hypothetical protein EA74_02343 [Enterococcus hirae]RBT66227.1 hypothetical protein EA82_02740 [Enterococcus hirae]
MKLQDMTKHRKTFIFLWLAIISSLAVFRVTENFLYELFCFGLSWLLYGLGFSQRNRH